MNPKFECLLGEREVAKLLSVSVALLQRWRCYGGGPCFVRVGARSIRYRYTDIETFVELNSTAAGLRGGGLP